MKISKPVFVAGTAASFPVLTSVSFYALIILNPQLLIGVLFVTELIVGGLPQTTI